MLLQPIVYLILIAFSLYKSYINFFTKQEIKVNFLINVVLPVIYSWILYYFIYGVVSKIEKVLGADLMSGHIFTGMLANGAILSSFIFA